MARIKENFPRPVDIQDGRRIYDLDQYPVQVEPTFVAITYGCFDKATYDAEHYNGVVVSPMPARVKANDLVIEINPLILVDSAPEEVPSYAHDILQHNLDRFRAPLGRGLIIEDGPQLKLLRPREQMAAFLAVTAALSDYHRQLR